MLMINQERAATASGGRDSTYEALSYIMCSRYRGHKQPMKLAAIATTVI